MIKAKISSNINNGNISAYAADTPSPARGVIRTFGRIRGKKLSARQEWLVQNVLPTIAPAEQIMFSQKGQGTPHQRPAILEIGFGAGEHVMDLALAHPDKIIIGAEPFINGVASLLSRMCMTESGMNNEWLGAKREFENIRIWPWDVRKMLTAMPGVKFDQIWILHPDPWPKARHEKRRLLSQTFLQTLASFISKDGRIIIGTDHDGYFEWICEQASAAKLQIMRLQNYKITTRYNQKNIYGGGGTRYMQIAKRF